jgi:hypothetical protein
MIMRKAFIVVVVSITLFGCATTDVRQFLQADNMVSVNPLLRRLDLQKSENELALSDVNAVGVNTYLYTMFERELVNISEQTGSIYGNIEVSVIYTNVKVNYAWLITSGLLLYVPNLVGMPIFSGVAQVEFDVKIKNLVGDVIWKNTYFGQRKKTYTIYHAETWNSEIKTVNILGIYQEKIQELKRDLNRDAVMINQSLGETYQ